MLLGSVADAVSHSEDAAAGEQAHDPLCISFIMVDSNVQVRRSQFNARATGNDSQLESALSKNTVSPVMAS